MADPYAVLGIGPDASRDDVRAAYRRLARRWHPDQHSSSSVDVRRDAERRMKELNVAYDEIVSGRASSPGVDVAYAAYRRRAAEAWNGVGTAFRETVGADASYWYAVGGPTVLDSLRELRDIFLGRQSPPLTIEQVARRLRTSPSVVVRLVERGALEAEKVAGRVRVTGDALAGYLYGRVSGSDRHG